jgi:hypothetical protein
VDWQGKPKKSISLTTALTWGLAFFPSKRQYFFGKYFTQIKAGGRKPAQNSYGN